MKIFVISLDNEEGEQRRSLLNYNYEWFKADTFTDAPDWIKEKFKCMYNCKEDLKKSKIGCLSSHLKVIKHIIDNKLNDIIVCEDDAILKNPYVAEGANLMIETLKCEIGSPILLTGVIHHPTSWAKDKEWKKSNDINFELGINEIDYSKFRWTNTGAIYYPSWEELNDIWDFAVMCDNLKSIDTFLCNYQMISHLHYPSIFKCVANKSTINGKNVAEIDNYKYV